MQRFQERDGEEDRRPKNSRNGDTEYVRLKVEDVTDRAKRKREI